MMGIETGGNKKKEVFTLFWSLSLVVLSVVSMPFISNFVANYPIVENIRTLSHEIITLLILLIIFLKLKKYLLYYFRFYNVKIKKGGVMAKKCKLLQNFQKIL